MVFTVRYYLDTSLDIRRIEALSELFLLPVRVVSPLMIKARDFTQKHSHVVTIARHNHRGGATMAMLILPVVLLAILYYMLLKRYQCVPNPPDKPRLP